MAVGAFMKSWYFDILAEFDLLVHLVFLPQKDIQFWSILC